MVQKTKLISTETQGVVSGRSQTAFLTPSAPIGIVVPAVVAGKTIIDATMGNVFNVLLNANAAMGISNVPPGKSVTVIFTQGGGGGFTTTWVDGNQAVNIPNEFASSPLSTGVTPYIFTCNTADGSGVECVEGPSSGSGGVSSVTGTAPIVSSGGATPAISIVPASGITAGSLSSSDYTRLQTLIATAVVNVIGVAPITSTGGTTPSLGINPAVAGVSAGSLSAADKTKLDSLSPGGVTSVTASGNMASSGGTTPNITITANPTFTNVTAALLQENGSSGLQLLATTSGNMVLAANSISFRGSNNLNALSWSVISSGVSFQTWAGGCTGVVEATPATIGMTKTAAFFQVSGQYTSPSQILGTTTGAVTWDANSGCNAALTATGACTVTISNSRDGGQYEIEFIPGGSHFTLSLPAPIVYPGANAGLTTYSDAGLATLCGTAVRVVVHLYNKRGTLYVDHYIGFPA